MQRGVWAHDRRPPDEIGPVEFIVVGFAGNRFTGEIAAELQALRDQGLVRILDLAVVSKDGGGNVSILEMQELSPEVAAAFVKLEGSISGLLSEADLDEIAEDLEPNSTAAAMLFEHVWASRFASAVRAANGGSSCRSASRTRWWPRRVPRSSPPPAEGKEPEMLGSRRGRPSLIGRAAHTAARTAVIVGTANAMTNRSAARHAAAAQPGPAPQAVAEAAAPTAGGLSDESIARLKQLADLHASGVLTAEEFAEQKARLLA